MDGRHPSHGVGIDWASDKHVGCVLDRQGQIALEFPIAHSAEGRADLLRRLRRFGAPEELPLEIERPSGVLKDARPRYAAARAE